MEEKTSRIIRGWVDIQDDCVDLYELWGTFQGELDYGPIKRIVAGNCPSFARELDGGADKRLEDEEVIKNALMKAMPEDEAIKLFIGYVDSNSDMACVEGLINFYVGAVVGHQIALRFPKQQL